jgi:N-hydroxyarylamine O-acetyltransferase
MDLQAYLDRIEYSGPITPTPDVLRDLHRLHLYAIPFENLDIPLGREITLDLERIYDKIVRRRRGGFCYEQNALLAWALRNVGFTADMLSAGVARQTGEYSDEFDHMLLLVRTPKGEQWIADVGFGDSFVEPLRFELNTIQPDRGLNYQIVIGDHHHVLRRRDAGEWKAQYRFTLTPRALTDFAARCLFQQTSPESHFTRNRICSQLTPAGRITLTTTSFIETRDGKRTELPVESNADFERLLEQHFGIVLSGFAAVAW